MGLPRWPTLKNPPANAGDAGDAGSIPRSGRSLGGGIGNSLQYSCLENPMDRGAWWATVHKGRKESDTTEHACLCLQECKMNGTATLEESLAVLVCFFFYKTKHTFNIQSSKYAPWYLSKGGKKTVSTQKPPYKYL